MSGRTAAQVVADEEQLAEEKRLITTARAAANLMVEATHAADMSRMAFHAGSLTYCVDQLTKALERRHGGQAGT